MPAQGVWPERLASSRGSSEGSRDGASLSRCFVPGLAGAETNKALLTTPYGDNFRKFSTVQGVVGGFFLVVYSQECLLWKVYITMIDTEKMDHVETEGPSGWTEWRIHYFSHLCDSLALQLLYFKDFYELFHLNIAVFSESRQWEVLLPFPFSFQRYKLINKQEISDIGCRVF